jgi:hypothetical protein
VKVPPEIVSFLIGFFMNAQARGWIDVKALEPLLRMIVVRGYAPNVRQMLGEILQTLEQIERDPS